MLKIARVQITAEGRDKGKHFLITEMSAMKAERWAIRLIFALSKAGVEVPEGEGMAAVAQIHFSPAIFGRIELGDANILLDEMMTCVEIIPDPNGRTARPVLETDIFEVSTLFKLRMEVIALHTGFSFPAYPSTAIQLGEAGQAFTHVPMSPIPALR